MPLRSHRPPALPLRPAAAAPLPRHPAAGPSPLHSVPIGPARFVGASLATTLLSLALLLVLVRGGLEPVVANVAASSAGAVASYWLNRHWVWNRRGSGINPAEVAAFWGLALAGLALSSAAVALADQWADAANASTTITAAGAVAANWTAFLALAALKYGMSRRLYGLAGPPAAGSIGVTASRR